LLERRENEYMKLCKEEALRGKVMFLGKIDHESNLLISAYATAKVHKTDFTSLSIQSL